MTSTTGGVTPVVLVHGAWHGAWCWGALQGELDRRGVPSYALDLPGHGLSDRPLGDLHGDAAFVAETIERLGQEVILVGHSYGGAVITEAANACDRVRRLVFLTAFVPDVGETMRSIRRLDNIDSPEGFGLSSIASLQGDGTIVLDPVGAGPLLYGRCAPAVQRAAGRRLGPQPVASFQQQISAASWKHIPSSYIRCTDDRAIYIGAQDAMAELCDEVFTLDTDHSPFASCPGETAELLFDIASRTS